MARIEGFEDLDAWQLARQLAGLVFKLSSQGRMARNYVLRHQSCRAAISVLSNIAEGFERGGNEELIYFLSVAKGSVGELRAQLFIALDCGCIDATQFEQLYPLSRQIGGKLGALIVYLRRSGMKGYRFRARASWRLAPEH